VLDDTYALFNTVFPVAYGGTGGSSKEAARTELELDKKVVYAAKSANYTALLADNNAVFRFTATATLSLDAAATLGSNWHAVVIADGGDVTIDPNSSETIDGAATLIVPNGYSAFIICDGSSFYTDKMVSLFQAIAFGQCRLTLSGGNLLLSRFNGNFLTINAKHYSIPSAGVTLAPSGLTPATLYYIYAYMNSGTMTLESSTTAYATDSTTGVQIKTGDVTRTLVGMARPETGPVFTDTLAKRFVRSWYNDPGVSLQNNFTANRATSSPHTDPQEVNSEIRCQFLLWAGERVKATTMGSFVNGNANGTQTTAIGFNTTSSPENGVIASVAASEVIPFSCTSVKEGLSEGLNFATLMGWVSSSGGATFYGDVNGRRTTLSVETKR
jgi:hypothetical protein